MPTARAFSTVSGQQTGETNKTYVSQLSYAASGAVKDMQLGNGLWEQTSLNSRLQPTEIRLGTTQGGIDRLKLTYDYGANNNGNVQSQTIAVPTIGSVTGYAVTQSYTYDALNRLKSVEELNGTTQSWKQTFIYDRYGNRNFDTANTTANALGSLLTIDQASNRFTANQGSILYDNAGNLTRDFQGHSFGYDADNKQTGYDGGAAAVGTDYKYDGDGRRVKKVNGTGQATTIFVYDAAGQLVAEYDSASPSGSGGTSYLTEDNLGTPRIITDASGAVKARHDYLPFGEEIGLSGGRTTQQGYVVDNVRQKFTHKERDGETGLDYFRARYYSSIQGRFTSVDPVGTSLSRMIDPQQINHYIYARNNPLKYLDPNGNDIKLALGLKKADAERIFKSAVKLYQKASGREALERMEKSEITYVYGTGKLGQNKNDNETLGRTGPTVESFKATKDPNNPTKAKTIERQGLVVTVTFDLEKRDRLNPPESEQHVFDHETGHADDLERDPVRQFNQSEEDDENNAETFANTVGAEKDTFKKEDAEKRVREILGLPPKEEKPKNKRKEKKEERPE